MEKIKEQNSELNFRIAANRAICMISLLDAHYLDRDVQAII